MAAPLNASSPPAFSRPTWAQIDLDALRHNARVLSRITPLIAVVKADAYGHGALPVARALCELPSVQMLAVASVDEGRVIREAGIEAPILLLSGILPDECEAVVEYNLTPTLSTLAVAHALNQAVLARKVNAQAHWKIDTGMGRLGTQLHETIQTWRALQEYSNLRIEGVYTHFACADEPENPMTLRQLHHFQAALDECKISPDKYLLHAANSAATLNFPQSHFSLVRCGLALYGANPFEAAQPDFDLQSVMSLRARIVEIRQIKKGRSISYGATWTATRDSRIALLPLGYADGYLRALSNKGVVTVRGERCPVVGRVTMDQILIDVTSLPSNVQCGEVAVAWGVDDNGRVLRVEEVASTAGTISYELLTRIAARVPRVYLN